MSTNALLKAEGITKAYGDLKVLKGVSIEMQEGEVVSIVGASGAGKSTLLHILGTLDSPDSGTLSIAGEDIHNLSSNALAKFRNESIGFVFQFHHLLPEFSAWENVSMPAWINGKATPKVKERALTLLDHTGLASRAHHRPSELSGGEQQRVAVARALMNNPKLVMADEPSGNLDSKTSEELHDLFFQLREEMGQTFVFVTHNESLANRADRKLEMADGLFR